MAEKLPADEIGEILDTYAETGSIKETAEKVDRSNGVVSKYVNKAREKGDERIPEEEHEDHVDLEEEYENFDMGGSPFSVGEEEEDANDYRGLGPGEFLEAFFEDFEVGVKKKWVKLQARRAERRGQLPTKESLVADLLSMKSGVAKSAHVEASYIADEYWAEATKFLQQTGYQAANLSNATNQGGQRSGPQMGGQGQMSYGNEFVGPNQQGAMGGGVGQQDDSMSVLLHELRQLRQDMNRTAGQQGQESERNETLERLKDLRQEKEILEELSGGDERMQQIEQQIMALQQQIQQGVTGGDESPIPNKGTFEDRLLELAAAKSDVSMREVLDYLDDRSEAEEHPDVLEKKYEKEMKEVELEHQTERAERVADTIENVAERVGAGFARQLAGGGAESAEPADEVGRQEATADGGSQPAPTGGGAMPTDTPTEPQMAAAQSAEELEECPNCGTQMQMVPGGEFCPECQYGIGQCDLCSFPIEIPPVGEAEFGRCGACETILERPADDGEAVECDQCGWEGAGGELRGELTRCGNDNCGEIRPIKRAVDNQEMMQQLSDITGD